MPRPPTLKNYNIEKGTTKLKPPVDGEQYADCVAITFNNVKNKLCCMYSDRTVFIWDLKKLDKLVVKRSFLNHSGNISDLHILNKPSSYEATFFATASSDKTVRIWHIFDEDEKGVSLDASSVLGIRRNAYSKYLSRILYVSNSVDHFKVIFFLKFLKKIQISFISLLYYIIL